MLSCELSWWWALPLAALALGEGVRLARRELERPPLALVITASGAARLDDHALTEWAMRWRFGLAVFGWRDAQGRWRQRIGWPGALDAAGRRELRLAVPVQARAQSLRSMAP